MRPAGIYKSHDRMNCTSRSSDLGGHEAGASKYFGHISNLAVFV